MNYDYYNNDESCLNPVNITSNVRAPGEYKYYYCGENNSLSDKSFLTISTMWYTTKIPEHFILLSSCYNKLYTSYLYYCPKNKIYNIYVYQNKLDYKSENIILKPIQLIQLKHCFREREIIIYKSELNGQPTINIKVKIYFGSDNYLLLNENDKRILLIDFYNGNYVTIFSNYYLNSGDPVYNIFDTYDEKYYLEGKKTIRTYVFLSIKYQEKKVTYYKYRYFIIERGSMENENFFLHSINLDLGNGEPLELKIAKIRKETGKENENNPQWFYIFCFLSTQRLFQLITNYNNLNLYKILKKINQSNKIMVPSTETKGLRLIKCSMTTIGLKVDKVNQEEINFDKNEDINNDSKNDNINLNNADMKNSEKILFWSTSINLWIEKKQIAQCVKIFLNINTKQLSALILFLEIGQVVSFPFNVNDSPEEIKNKITITSSEIQIDKLRADSFGAHAKIYKFEEHYLFKSNTVCALTSKNLILAIDNKFRIYDLETNVLLYKYNFYKENIICFLLFNKIGTTFFLTTNKIFKIIFNTRYRILSENEIKNNPKSPINAYKEEDLNFPIFENNPEDIWNSYCSKLEINEEDSELNLKNEQKGFCTICSKKTEFCCNGCSLKYYCCNEHFEYDYNNIHFFECQLVQFFKRKDILSIDNKEIRYMVLYNELIKLCGRILNYMFSRIFVGKDCHKFLEMLLNLISLLDNFGFYINYSEFCSSNLLFSKEMFKQKPEKILFYEECIYFYAHLHILKCTFTLKSKLYNMTDCYIKIIKNDIFPKLTPKNYKNLTPLRCEKLKKDTIFQNKLYLNFKSPIFFDLKKIYDNVEGDFIDIIEAYILKHLMTLSLLIKFKMKLHSSIDVNYAFIDICLMFDSHFRENKLCKNIVPYCYFSISFYLVEIGKVSQSIKLLKRMVTSFTDKTDKVLKGLTFYNLGILQYALGEFKIGIHNLETAYKLSDEFFLSEQFKNKITVTLGLAYLNQKNLFKAYVLIQKSKKELKIIKKQKYELKCIKLNVYLNYIIDLYEYLFITQERLQLNRAKKNKNHNFRDLLDFVEGEYDKKLIIVEQHINEFLKVVEFIWNLPSHTLNSIQIDNPPKPAVNYKEEIRQEKNLSFNLEQSQMSTFLMKGNALEKEENQEEYDDDIEIKQTLFDSLTRQQQTDFKELKKIFLKRDIVLRDSLGSIEKFNINYDPEFSIQFKKIIEKLKSNFLLKEIFYCFQNEKWRDELYNYSSNNILFGLSKYLKLEKIKNVIAVEKSKCLDKIKKEKKNLLKGNKSFNEDFLVETNLLKKINIENNIYPSMSNSDSSVISLQNNSENSLLFSRYKSEDMTYVQFKEMFIKSLKENYKYEKEDKLKYLNLKDDYLLTLYNNVYLNNPEQNFIFQNPSLILNYIFIDISNNNEIKKEAEKIITMQEIKEEEKKSYHSSENNNSNKVKKEEEEDTNKNNNRVDENKDNKNIFTDKSKLIISPILENINDKSEENINDNNNDEKIESRNISTEIYHIDSFIYLKYENEEDNLQIESKVCHLEFICIKKKDRNSSSSIFGNFHSYSKKKTNPERKSILPALFLRFSSKQNFKKGDNLKNSYNFQCTLSPKKTKKKWKNRKLSAITKSYKNRKYIKDIKKEKKEMKKKEKSCTDLHKRLSIAINPDKLLNDNNSIAESSLETENIKANLNHNNIHNEKKNLANEINNLKEQLAVNINDNNNKKINNINNNDNDLMTNNFYSNVDNNQEEINKIEINKEIDDNPIKNYNDNISQNNKFDKNEKNNENMNNSQNNNEIKNEKENNTNNINKDNENGIFINKDTKNENNIRVDKNNNKKERINKKNIKKLISNKTKSNKKKNYKYSNKNNNKITKNEKKKEDKINNIIINENIKKENNDIKIQDIKKSDDINIKDNSPKLNEGNRLFNISKISNKKIEKTRNKKNKPIKNKSVKQFNNYNYSLISNDKNYGSIKNKILSNSTKRILKKPKTYNVFSSEDLNKNTYLERRQPVVQPYTQGRFMKNYGFKNREEQESEIIEGAIKYLQFECYKRNRKENHILNSSGITMRELQHKFKIVENNNKILNKNNYKVPYDYKKNIQQIGEETTISLNSTSSGLFLINNISLNGNESQSIEQNKSIFQKEMNRIINFNKKMKSTEKDILANNKDNNKSHKKISSQKNLFDYKLFKNSNENISIKNNNSVVDLYINKKKSNKALVNNNSLNKNKIISRNENFKKTYNIKKQNFSQTNISSNKENNKKIIVDFFQDEQELFQKKKKNNYNDINDEKSNDLKFRFVLDKYCKTQRPKIKKKEEEKINKNDLSKNKILGNRLSSVGDIKGYKKINNQEKICENLSNLNVINNINNKIGKTIYLEKNFSKENNKVNILEFEKLNLSVIKKRENSNLNSSKENLKQDNSITNEEKNKNLNSKIDITNEKIIKDFSYGSSCIGSVDDINLKSKINLPINIGPLIKRNNKKYIITKENITNKNNNSINNQSILNTNFINISNTSRDTINNFKLNSRNGANNLKEESKTSNNRSKNINSINNLMNLTHERPKNFNKKNEKQIIDFKNQ